MDPGRNFVRLQKSRLVESGRLPTRMSIVHDCTTFWPLRPSKRPVLARIYLIILNPLGSLKYFGFGSFPA
jgi:hypothetical protein